MTTIKEICDSGNLSPITVALKPRELAWRRLYGTIDFIQWLDRDLAAMAGDPLHSTLTPIEQVFALFSEFIVGDDFLTDRRFRKLNWTPDHGIWELKTSDVRIFGWVPEKDCFICCHGDAADRIKNLDLYGRYIAQSKYVMDNLPLDEPKCIISRKHEDVISTKD